MWRLIVLIFLVAAPFVFAGLWFLVSKPLFTKQVFSTGAQKAVRVGASVLFGALSLGLLFFTLRNLFPQFMLGSDFVLVGSNIAVVAAGGIAVLGLLTVLISVCGLIADIAKSKGRSWAAFFWMSALFSPLIVWIIASAMSPMTPQSAFVAQPATDNISVKMEGLQDLYNKGLLTESEFHAKRQELLSRF